MHSVRFELGDKQGEATGFPKFRPCHIRYWGESVIFTTFSLLIPPRLAIVA